MTVRYPRGMILAPMIFLFFFGTAPAIAETAPLTITASRQYAFAEHLFQTGEYRRAAEAYQKFAFFFPSHPLRRTAEFQTAQAYQFAGDLATALKHYRPLTRFSGAEPDPVAVDAYFMMAECYFQMRATGQAVLQLRNLITLCDKVDVQDKAYYRMGFLHVDQGDWGSARNAWSRISANSRYPRERLLKAAGEDAAQLPRKSPAMAGTLSLIPGMGQLYLGRGQDALVAFVITTGTAWAACEAFDNDLPVLGVMLSIIGAGFYSGNIYSAISGAHKYNRLSIQNFSRQLRQETDDAFPHRQQSGRHDTGMGIELKINF